MTSEIEPAKLLLPYLQRADELQKHEPLVAYYCRLYAMDRGLNIPQKERTKATNALLVSLMNQLEKDKKSVNLGPDDHLHVEGFALNVFSKADKQDRAGRADLNTAKTFYAANIFFDILKQFGEVQPDLEQKHKYAAWKAADIRKALSEGRKPLPGPPGGEPAPSSGEYDLVPSSSDDATRPNFSTTAPDSSSSPHQYGKANLQHSNISPQHSNITRSSSNSSTLHHHPSGDYPSDNFHHPSPFNGTERSIHPQSYHHQPFQPDFQQHLPHSYPNFHSYPSFTESSLPTAPSDYPSYHQSHGDAYPNFSPSNNVSVSEPSPTTRQEYEYDSNYEPLPGQIAEAQKAARFAVSALAFDDVFVAVDFLKKSLELLTKPSASH
ncbi:protein OF MAMMALIAN LYST-INTERACTING PROTEIN 5-like [Salvia divinorum]|uniref:Protein OF MAMMALIAN LYST-INTERACTING PROTEIN 5-like n=1 Tax=Salvia divinorum TaxID=28513 RepID=A0ABD1I3J1_SALDI